MVKKALILWLSLLLSTGVLLAQDKEFARLVGKVTASTGEALPGVAVVLKNVSKGTITDLDGNFQIEKIQPGNYILQIQFLGFTAQEQEVNLEPAQVLKVSISLKESTLEMDAVEIEGKSISQEINEQAYAVSAVSTKDLYNTTADAKEVLNRISGVRILEEGGLGSGLTFSLNGFSGDQVKFFMDGIPMDNFGSSLSLSSIPINAIQRIEVYKGVVPVWLGTDALGGAVNIVTNQNDNFLDASYSLGSFNTHRVSINGATTNPETGFTVRGNLSYNYSDNNYKVWVPITDPLGNVQGNAEMERFHDRYRSGMAKVEAGFVNKKYADQLLVGLIASADDNQIQNGATMARAYGGMMQKSKSIIPTLKYSKKDLFIKGLDVSLNSSINVTQTQNIDTLRGVYYNWQGEAIPHGDNGENGDVNNTELDDREVTSQLNIGYSIAPKHSLNLNYSYQYFYRKAFDSENPDNLANQFPNSLNKQVVGFAYKYDHDQKWSTTLFSKAFFLHVATSKEYDFGQETRRMDVYEARKENFGYGLATSYLVTPNLQLKASYEHTYRMPWANEIFGNGLFVLANADLGPEQSDNFNLGASYDFRILDSHRFKVESSFIYRESDDLIYQVVTVASPETSYNNLAEVRTLGYEGSLNYQWKSLRIGGNLTYQHITDQADQVYNDYSGYQRNFNKGYRLPNRPYLFGNAQVGYAIKDAFFEESTLSINYFYSFVKSYFLSWARFGSTDSKKVIPAQSSHNVELNYSLQDGKYNISLECRNLTDERLYDKYYLQKPGRAFYLKVRYALGR